MDFKEINSLKDLQKAQELLKLESRICKEELGREVGMGKTKLQSLFFTFGISLGIAALFRKIPGSSAKEAHDASEKSSSSIWWSHLLPLIPEVLQFFRSEE